MSFFESQTKVAHMSLEIKATAVTEAPYGLGYSGIKYVFGKPHKFVIANVQ